MNIWLNYFSFTWPGKSNIFEALLISKPITLLNPSLHHLKPQLQLLLQPATFVPHLRKIFEFFRQLAKSLLHIRLQKPHHLTPNKPCFAPIAKFLSKGFNFLGLDNPLCISLPICNNIFKILNNLSEHFVFTCFLRHINSESLKPLYLRNCDLI